MMATYSARFVKWLAAWLRIIAQRLDPVEPSYVYVAEMATDEDFERPEYLVAKRLTQYWATKGVAGEYKRHQVYTALRKSFPTLPHRHLSLAIERCLESTYVAKRDRTAVLDLD
jgi:hypothetical protein